MIILGCPKLDELIKRFDNQTINGITYHFKTKRGIQAFFEFEGGDEDMAIMNAKQFMRKDSFLSKYMCSALHENGLPY